MDIAYKILVATSVVPFWISLIVISIIVIKAVLSKKTNKKVYDLINKIFNITKIITIISLIGIFIVCSFIEDIRNGLLAIIFYIVPNLLIIAIPVLIDLAIIDKYKKKYIKE